MICQTIEFLWTSHKRMIFESTEVNDKPRLLNAMNTIIKMLVEMGVDFFPTDRWSTYGNSTQYFHLN